MTSNTHKSFSHISSPSSFFSPSGKQKKLFTTSTWGRGQQKRIFLANIGANMWKTVPPRGKNTDIPKFVSHIQNGKNFSFFPRKKVCGLPPNPEFLNFRLLFFPAGKCEVGICSKYRPWDILRRWRERHFPNISFFSPEKKVEERDAKIESEILLLPPFKNVATIPATGSHLSGRSYLFRQILQKKILRRDTTRYFPKKSCITYSLW